LHLVFGGACWSHTLGSAPPGNPRKWTQCAALAAFPGRKSMNTVRLEPLARGAVEIPLQPASEDIWDKKYRLKAKDGTPIDATVEATWERIARALAEVEATPEARDYWHGRFLWALRRGAIPAGRITSNAGAQ